MDVDEETPKKRKYPLRERKMVRYDDYDTPGEETPLLRKQKKKDDLSFEEEDSSFKENKNKEIENETFDENEEEISEYEKQRLKNLEENRRIMMELGILNPQKTQPSNVRKTQPKQKQKIKPPKPPKSLEPTKRSLRLLKKTPEGKDLPVDVFQESPAESPCRGREDQRFEEEQLPMGEDGETIDFLDNLKMSLSQDSGISSLECVENLIRDIRALKFGALERVTRNRITSMCVHPMESNILILTGDKFGYLGLWDTNNHSVVNLRPHSRNLNCLTISGADQAKVLCTSHEGTVRRGDLNKEMFDLIYQTDEKRNFCHLTWHSEKDANTLLIAHGSGEVGLVDVRDKSVQRWYHCHVRSVRTTHIHPTQPQYFLTSSGTGECKIWDIRSSKKHTDDCVSELPTHSKALTSAFFSPDGNKLLTTCNDDYLRIFDSSDISNLREQHKVMHDNHTGRWLSVFKAIWHTHSSDLIFVGSMLHPRQIQVYSGSGQLVRELVDDQLATVVSVIALHPTLPVVVGGNSTGKAHIFSTRHYIDTHLATYGEE